MIQNKGTIPVKFISEEHNIYDMQSSVTKVHNTEIIDPGTLPPSELIFSFVCCCSCQKQVLFDAGGLPSKLWTMNPPAPLWIKDTQVFDRSTPCFRWKPAAVCCLPVARSHDHSFLFFFFFFAAPVYTNKIAHTEMMVFVKTETHSCVWGYWLCVLHWCWYHFVGRDK